MTDEVALQRMIRLAEEAERYEAGLLQVAAQMKLYREAHGKDAETTDVLNVWVRTHLTGPIDPYQVLTRGKSYRSGRTRRIQAGGRVEPGRAASDT